MWCTGGCSWNCYKNFPVLLTFHKVQTCLHLPHETISQRPKTVRGFWHSWLGNVLRATNGGHIFKIATLKKWSEAGPNMWYFQFWLAHRATTRALFQIATSKSHPKLACLRILTWKCASRSSWQIARTRRFSKPTCSTLQNHTSPERHSESRLSHLFFAHLLFSLFLFSDPLTSFLLLRRFSRASSFFWKWYFWCASACLQDLLYTGSL